MSSTKLLGGCIQYAIALPVMLSSYYSDVLALRLIAWFIDALGDDSHPDALLGPFSTRHRLQE